VERRCAGEGQAVVAAADAFRRSKRGVRHDDDLWKVQARQQMRELL
jgi:hypothetical protein